MSQSDSNPSQLSDSLLTGKITGNFADFGPTARFSRPGSQRIQWLAAEFPYAMEQGIFVPEQGKT
jgi:hypothetical protein